MQTDKPTRILPPTDLSLIKNYEPAVVIDITTGRSKKRKNYSPHRIMQTYINQMTSGPTSPMMPSNSMRKSPYIYRKVKGITKKVKQVRAYTQVLRILETKLKPTGGVSYIVTGAKITDVNASNRKDFLMRRIQPW